jgi:hypothetical protein
MAAISEARWPRPRPSARGPRCDCAVTSAVRGSVSEQAGIPTVLKAQPLRPNWTELNRQPSGSIPVSATILLLAVSMNCGPSRCLGDPRRASVSWLEFRPRWPNVPRSQAICARPAGRRQRWRHKDFDAPHPIRVILLRLSGVMAFTGATAGCCQPQIHRASGSGRICTL